MDIKYAAAGALDFFYAHKKAVAVVVAVIVALAVASLILGN